MPITFALPDGYGYPAAIGLGVIPLLSWIHGSIVTSYRKPAGVPYPNAYATAEQAKNNQMAYKFNCAQRAHANYLENMPQTMAYTLFAGAFYPQATVGLASFWLLCRALYAYGYVYSGKANGSGRMWGSGFWLAQGGLWGMSVYAALTQLL